MSWFSFGAKAEPRPVSGSVKLFGTAPAYADYFVLDASRGGSDYERGAVPAMDWLFPLHDGALPVARPFGSNRYHAPPWPW